MHKNVSPGAPYQPKGRPSLRGVLLREWIALGVKITGGDIIAFGKKYGDRAPSNWQPPTGWEFEKISLPGGAFAQYLIPENCTRRDKVILQLHGGGYMIGFLPVFQRRSDKLCKLGGNVPVFSLDYRVAPEYPYPAALDDAVEAVEWLRREKGAAPESLVAIGESAGAGLILALSMRMRDEGIGALRAMVLMSPWADLTCRGDSYARRYHMDPMFGRKMPPPTDAMRTSVSQVYSGDYDLTDPYISPAFGNFSDLPPMLIHVGEYEMLYDDAVTCYKKATAAGVKAELKVWPGMFHAFQLADSMIPEARAAWLEIGEFMRLFLA